jgi:hypothetical protein
MPLMPPELDIVVFAVNSTTTSEASKSARRVFERAAEENLHLALIELPASLVQSSLRDIKIDSEKMTCLRSVLMKPEHREWTTEIMELLNRSL